MRRWHCELWLIHLNRAHAPRMMKIYNAAGVVFDKALKNASYTSPNIQKEILLVFSCKENTSALILKEAIYSILFGHILDVNSRFDDKVIMVV